MTVSPASMVFRKYFTLYPTSSFNNNHQHSPVAIRFTCFSGFCFHRKSHDENDLLLPIQEWENKVVDEVVSEYKEGLLKGGVNDVAQLEYKMIDLLKSERMTIHSSTSPAWRW